MNCTTCKKPIHEKEPQLRLPNAAYHYDCIPDDLKPGTDAYRERIEREYGQMKLEAK